MGIFATLPVALLTFALACLWLKHEMPAMKANRLLNLSLIADPLLRVSMMVYVCVPGMFIGINVTGDVLSAERGQHDASRDGHAYAAVVSGIVYGHHRNGPLL